MSGGAFILSFGPLCAHRIEAATMLSTRLTEIFNVKYPIMLAGMAGVSLAEVVAAVSEAGGYGVLAREI